MISLLPFVLYACLMPGSLTEPEIEKPLPELGSFLQGIRGKLHADQTLLGNYTYTERTVVQLLDGHGQPKKPPRIRVYEVYPTAEPGKPYKKLISVKDKPLSPQEASKRDRNDEKKREEISRKQKPES